METTAAIEEAFICGDWERVLQQSREQLLRHVSLSEARDGTMAQAEEALVSMYLQSVFELAKHDEVETAVMLMQSLAPLPFHISLQWIKFLIAMDSRSVALELLNESLEKCASDVLGAEQPSEWRSRYAQLTELLVFHVLLPSESPKVARDYITKDAVLDQATKQRILDAVQAASPQHTQEATHAAARPDPASAHAAQQSSNATATSSRQQQPPAAAARTGDAHQEGDSAGDLVTIGGTALAVAALAIGVYRYRDTLRETVAEIGPAVSKGLADAKYALFES